MDVIVSLLVLIGNLYMLLLLARALVSWFTVDPYHPIVQALYRVTEPVLKPIRERLPVSLRGGVDYSPLIAMLIIWLVTRVIDATF